jgi:predicted MFS family arabinose efflux permease
MRIRPRISSAGVEALKMVADQDHGAALGVYTAFLDLAMGITGPIAGFIVGKFGYPAIFLFGSGAAGCAVILTLLLYHSVREPRALPSLKMLALPPSATPKSGEGRAKPDFRPQRF